jgi:hypothetical protein
MPDTFTPLPPLPTLGSPNFDAEANATFVGLANFVGEVNNLPGLFTRLNIIGEVTQSGGVPTGALIEIGSGSNGAYLRLAGGLQVCWHNLTTSTSAGVIWTFPKPFVNTSIRILGTGRTASFNLSPAATNVTATQAEIGSFNSANGRVANSTDLLAIGFWHTV